MFRSILRVVAPKAFTDGLSECNILTKKIIRKPAKRLLDLGCGDGTLTLEFAKVARSKEIYGIDYVEEFCAKARKNGVKCTRGDLNEKWSYKDNSFDLIISSQNIQGIHNIRLFFEECYRCLKPGGQLLILTENLATWPDIAALVFGWQPFSMTRINGWALGNPFIWHQYQQKNEKFIKKYNDTGVSGTTGHVRILAYQGLKELLERVGFKTVEMHTTGYLPFWGWFSNFMCRIDPRHGHFQIANAIK